MRNLGEHEIGAAAFHERIALVGAQDPAAQQIGIEFRRGDVVAHADGKMQDALGGDPVGGADLGRVGLLT